MFDNNLDPIKGYEFLGTITVSGYQIIRNIFKDKPPIYNFCFSDENWLWIKNNWDFLENYFKDEEEILILNIEKVEKE